MNRMRNRFLPVPGLFSNVRLSLLIGTLQSGNLFFNSFKDRFGAIISTLRELSDFKLVRLTPDHGTFVKGFGQAYRLEGARLDKAVHIQRNA